MADLAYIIGGAGTGADAHERNGGGYLTTGTADYSTCQGTNGGPIATCSGGSISNGGGFVVITKTGAFTNVVNGAIANVDYSATLADGRYTVLSHTDDTITIQDDYEDPAGATADVRVGGALGNSTTHFTDELGMVDSLIQSGDTLLIPNGSAGQRTYTESGDVTITGSSAGVTKRVLGVQNDGFACTVARAAVGSGSANGLLVETNFPKIAFSTTKALILGSYSQVKNLSILGDVDASNDGVINPLGSSCALQNLSVTNTGKGQSYYGTDSHYSVLYNCDFICAAADHDFWNVYTGTCCNVVHCRFRGNTSADSTGILVLAYGSTLQHCVFETQQYGYGVVFTAYGTSFANVCVYNTFFNVAAAINSTSMALQASPFMVANNIIVNATVGIQNLRSATAPDNLAAANNAFYNVTTTVTDSDWYGISATTAADRGDITLTADPFVDSANGDFNLDSTNGADCIGASVFGTDLGALAHEESAGGESAVWPAEANVSTVETAWGPTGAEYAGALDLTLYVLKTAVVSESWVVTGHSNYTGGTPGTYPTTATSKAEQLAEDVAAVNAAKANIKDDTTILTVTGTYDFTTALADSFASGQADQLVTDKAAVTAAAASIKDDTTILTITGTYDFTQALSDSYDSGAAAQLVTDKAAVTAAAGSIKDDATILTIAGTYDFTAAIAAGYASGQSDQLATDVAAVDAGKASILDSATILTVTGTFDESARNTDPGAANVWHGTSYKIQNVDKTGSKYASDITNCEAGNIKKDITIDDVTGTLEVSGGVSAKNIKLVDVQIDLRD